MRHRAAQALDSQSSVIGDVGFIGVNARIEPHALPPGYASEAINCRFRNGIVETRRGFVKLPWLNNITATTITISSITRSSSTATATTASAHGLATNSIAQISGATQTEYNGAFIITVTGATTFTYTVSGAPATPATGSPVLSKIDQTPFGAVYGVGQFGDPNTGMDYMLIAADGNVYASRDSSEARVVPLPAGVTVTTPCTFVQAFDTVVLFRGFDAVPLAMYSVSAGFESIEETPTTITRNGTTATVTTPQNHYLYSGESAIITGCDQSEYNGEHTITVTGDTTFTYTVSGSPVETATGDIRVDSDGTEPIPNSERGLFISNRLVIPNSSDEITVSDLNSYTKYLPVLSELRINTGSADALVNLAKFNETTLIAFKEHSVYALSNFYRDLSDLRLDQITDRFGLVAAESIAHCGTDLLFLSQMGVMSLRQTEDNKVQGVILPLSDPIQPIIDRINWNHASTAQAAYWDSKYYLAVPLDDAEILGPERLTGTRFPASQTITVPVTSGATYRFTKTENETSITNGGDTYTRSLDFVAAGSTVTIAGVEDVQAQGGLQQIYSGVNNAVLVYDFLNKAWSGYDEAEGFSVKKFHVRKYQGLDRLFVIRDDGWTVLYEEDFQDVVSMPYTDVTVVSAASNGNTIRVNTGTTITASGAVNGATNMEIAIVEGQIERLWSNNGYGYSPSSASGVWSSPNTLPVLTDTGVRFYATNGIQPVVATTGSWATITETAIQEINSVFTTRGYLPDGGESLSDFDWLCLDIQTWKPDYSLELITDGPYEIKTVSSSITKSRTAYTIFGRADYVNTNTGADHDTDHREDYSVCIGNGTNDAASFRLGSGSCDVGRHQEFREEFKVRKRGRSARVKINSSQGRFRLMAVKLENRKAQTRSGGKT